MPADDDGYDDVHNAAGRALEPQYRLTCYCILLPADVAWLLIGELLTQRR